MLRINRVQIRNVRSVQELDVQFDTDGVTAIVGASGAGKSTIMASIAWCLWGEVRGGLVQAEARRDGADPNDPCEVVVDAVCDGTTIRARRALRQHRRKGKISETASAQLWIDGDEQENITPTGLTSQITSITGLTGRAFAGAFYMPQGQLEALAEGTPAEIAALFEEQTGLDRLTKKLTAAAEHARELSKAAGAMPGSSEQAAAADADAKEAEAEAKSLADAATQARQRADALTAQWRAARQQADTLADQADAARQADREAAETAARAAQAAEHATSAAAQAAATGFADADAAQVAEADAEQRKTAAQQAGSRLAAAMQAAGQAREDLAAIDTSHLPSQADLDAAIAAQQAAVEASEKDAEAPRGVLAQLAGETARLRKITDTLTAAGDQACCPTCAQSLPAGAAGLLADIERDLAACEQRRRQEQQRLDAATRAHKDAVAALDAARREAAQVATARARAADAAARVDKADKALAAAIPAGQKDPASARATLQDAYRKASADARTAALAASAHQAAAAAATQAQAAAGQARQAAERRDAANPPDPQKVADARAAAAERRAEADAASAEASQAEALAASGRDGATLLRQTADTQRDQWETKRDMQRAAEQAGAAHNVLKAYRQEVLAEYTSAVADAATDLEARLGTEHVGFDLDGDFTPRVVLADGTTRLTKVLSGGEKARAALCFRLGIAQQITGGQAPGMVLADEITSAHDVETRGAIMSMLKQLGLPVVIISHSPEITDIATSVIRLAKGDSGTVQQADAA